MKRLLAADVPGTGRRSLERQCFRQDSATCSLADFGSNFREKNFGSRTRAWLGRSFISPLE